MRRAVISATVLWALTLLLDAWAGPSRVAHSPAATHGRQLYISNGCYECHGYGGEGAVGPRLGPNPLPLDVFTRQLRNPINFMPIHMPVYTAKVLSPADVAAIYAFLKALPEARPVAEIPLLK
jgi:ubiquinol-cytochrome c reductase cytochrome c subunit